MNKIIYLGLGILLIVVILFARANNKQNDNVVLPENIPTPVQDQKPILEVASGNVAELKVGQALVINGLLVVFNGVVADNRCPKDVNCIEAGAITANVTLTKGSDTKTFNMPSDEVPHQFVGYKISIVEINPPLYSTVQPDPKGYLVTFKVENK